VRRRLLLWLRLYGEAEFLVGLATLSQLSAF